MNKFFFYTLILLLFLVYIFIVPGYVFFKDTLEKEPLEKKIEKIQSKKHYTNYNNIPKVYFMALVATEDRRFYKHNGLDLIGSTRAIFTNLKEKKLKEGGSTLSQQLAKNLYFPLDYSIKRKVAEIFMALEIERKYTKKEILEIYVNVIYYGSGYYGIYDASKGYFHKKPKNLNLDECSILVGIPNAPSKYSLKVNKKLCYERQNKVLREMVKSGYIRNIDRENIVNRHLK